MFRKSVLPIRIATLIGADQNRALTLMKCTLLLNPVQRCVTSSQLRSFNHPSASRPLNVRGTRGNTIHAGHSLPRGPSSILNPRRPGREAAGRGIVLNVARTRRIPEVPSGGRGRKKDRGRDLVRSYGYLPGRGIRED